MWTQSPKPKPYSTKASGNICKREPLSEEESQERDAGVDGAYQMPWPTWQTKSTLHDDSDWLGVEGGEEELECSWPLELHLQEVLSGEEMFLPRSGGWLPINFDA